MDGLIIMPRVFINLLYTHTTPNNHYSTTYMLPYPHLLAKHCLRVGRKSRSEARNLPTCGCKSMMDGLIIMPRVFINIVAIPPLDGQTKPDSCQKIKIKKFEIIALLLVLFFGLIFLYNQCHGTLHKMYVYE